MVDPQAASDADLDASRALLVALCRFHQPGLREEALDTRRRRSCDVEIAAVPGAAGADGRPVGASRTPVTVNPSYFSPATFAALRRRVGRRPLGQPGGELALDHRAR